MINKTYHPRNKKIQGYFVQDHPSYSSWVGLKTRCNNKNEISYVNYGGRGIGYCEEWEHFENFVFDMGIKPTPGHTIERVNNDEGYCKQNCIWATRHEQSLNRRTFSNNTSGVTGVKLMSKSGRYSAAVNFKNIRYTVSGTFETVAQAEDARFELLIKLKAQLDVSQLTDRKARFDNSTGVRGISKHVDGGFMVRITRNGVRKYIGYYKNIDDAKKAIENEKD